MMYMGHDLLFFAEAASVDLHVKTTFLQINIRGFRFPSLFKLYGGAEKSAPPKKYVFRYQVKLLGL